MKKLQTLVFVSTSLISMSALAIVIYGDDHRREIHEVSAFHQKLARSAAVMIPSSKKTIRPDGTVDLIQETVRQWMENELYPESRPNTDVVTFCDSEPFTDQPKVGTCSGFLIAPDLLVTAGHCSKLENFCHDYDWIFDYKIDKATGKAGLGMNSDNIYKCKRVVSSSLSLLVGHDYTLIQLDRLVHGREPLEFRKSGIIPEDSPLAIIGSPMGLPLKFADGAYVRTNDHPFYFTSNLDSFQGSSGSPVFNAKTGLVEGILVRGEDDFGFNEEMGCIEANWCPDDGCRGEEVSRMTSIPEVALAGVLESAAISGDLDTLKNIISLQTWVDFYSKDRKSPLMKAAGVGQFASVELLVKAGADVNLADINGDTPLHHLARSLNNKNIRTLEVLLAAQANLEVRNHLGQTPLKVAEKFKNRQGAKIIRKLLKKKKRTRKLD